MTNYVYEIIDATDDERYFTRGIFSEPRVAIGYITEPEGYTLADDFSADTYVTLKVIRRVLNGWSDSTHTIATVHWEERYDEEKDEIRWEITSKELPE